MDSIQVRFTSPCLTCVILTCRCTCMCKITWYHELSNLVKSFLELTLNFEQVQIDERE